MRSPRRVDGRAPEQPGLAARESIIPVQEANIKICDFEGHGECQHLTDKKPLACDRLWPRSACREGLKSARRSHSHVYRTTGKHCSSYMRSMRHHSFSGNVAWLKTSVLQPGLPLRSNASQEGMNWMSGFLQFGYLGLLGLVIYLSYRIVVKDSRWSFSQAVILILIFVVISIGGGGVGYLWASKELEAANAKKSTTAIVMEQVKSLQEMHKKDMEPLQSALSDASKNLTTSYIESYRKQYREEITSLNDVIRSRNEAFTSQISALQKMVLEKN